MSNLAITIWTDSTDGPAGYKIWRKNDAYYASNDPGWIMNINIDELLEEIANGCN